MSKPQPYCSKDSGPAMKKLAKETGGFNATPLSYLKGQGFEMPAMKCVICGKPATVVIGP